MNTNLATEIDGPAMAYWELNDGVRFIRFVYRTVAYSGFDSFEAAGHAIDKLRERINEAFPHEVRLDNCGYIIWRTRPEITEILEERGVIKDNKTSWKKVTVPTIAVFCRFATSPPLPESFWLKHEKKEGEPLRPAAELG